MTKKKEELLQKKAALTKKKEKLSKRPKRQQREDDVMEYVPRDASVRLLKKYLPEIGLTVPLSESDLDEASDFFDAMEFSLAVDKNEGREYDQDLLDAVCRAYDDFTPIEDEDYVDMDALNARLQSAEPWSPPPAQEKTKKPGKRRNRCLRACPEHYSAGSRLCFSATLRWLGNAL